MDPRIAGLLEATYHRYHTEAHLRHDPLGIVRRYRDRADLEVAGIIASSFAFGRVDTFLPKIEALLARLGPSPAHTLRTATAAHATHIAEGLRHRFVGPKELAAFLRVLTTMLCNDQGLRPAFDQGYQPTKRVEDGLRTLSIRLRGSGDCGFLVPAFEAGSAMKRLNLFLRWMVRNDGLDLGVWQDIPPARLLFPLDVHVFWIAQKLGLLGRTRGAPRLKDAVALRDALARIDPVDPVRFDFALSHLGISGDCQHGRNPAACATCVLREICDTSK